MKTQDRELLFKDLCARVPYGVMVQVTSKHPVILGDGNESDELDEPYDISLTIDDHDSLVDFFNGDWVIDIKPYLRPMESMTKEEYKEYSKLWNLQDEFPTDADIRFKIDVFDWLYAHHFDVRHLIEKDLALPAPEEMYNFK